MSVYAESSAILAWLLGESAGTIVGRELIAADTVVVSSLAFVEIDRSLHRAVHLGQQTVVASASLRQTLGSTSAYWVTLGLSPDVVEDARRVMPVEPVRALDALHIASASVARLSMPAIRMLSLDDRIRANAVALGFVVLPETAA